MNTIEGDPKTELRVGYNYKSVNLRGWTILYSRSAGHTLITHTCLQTKAADFTLKLLESSMLLKTCTNWTHIFAQKMCWRQSFNYKPLRLQNIYNSIKNFNNYICINLAACYYREFWNNKAAISIVHATVVATPVWANYYMYGQFSIHAQRATL